MGNLLLGIGYVETIDSQVEKRSPREHCQRFLPKLRNDQGHYLGRNWMIRFVKTRNASTSTTIPLTSSTVRPKPSHPGHAPSGLLAENNAGVGSGNALPHCEQLKRRSKSSAAPGCIRPLSRSTRTVRARPPPR